MDSAIIGTITKLLVTWLRPSRVYMVRGILYSLYMVYYYCLLIVLSGMICSMPLTCDSRVAKASGELVQRAKPVLTSYTSRRALESGPKWRLRAVSIAKEPALRAGWSWSTRTKRRVSVRAFGGVFSALRAKAVLG